MARVKRYAVRLRVQSGQGMAEYALILSLVAVVVIVALQFLGGTVSSLVSKVGTSI